MTAIRLARAMICTSCELILDSWPRCPQCAKSDFLMPVAKWLKPIETTLTAALDAVSAVRATRPR
jgi:hypothetical protein